MGQSCCCANINHAELGIKERYGKFDDVLEPGCHWVNWCSGSQIKGIINLRLQVLDVTCLTKTKDHIFLSVKVSVHYRVSPGGASNAFYSVTDPRPHIRAFVLEVITSAVPKMNANDVYEKKDNTQKLTTEYLQKELAPYGMDIMKALIIEIGPTQSLLNNSKDKYGGSTRNEDLDVHTSFLLQKISNGFDAILEHLHAKNEVQQRLLDIEERNSKLHEQQVAIGDEQIQVAKESLSMLVESNTRKMESIVGALNNIVSAISTTSIN